MFNQQYNPNSSAKVMETLHACAKLIKEMFYYNDQYVQVESAYTDDPIQASIETVNDGYYRLVIQDTTPDSTWPVWAVVFIRQRGGDIKCLHIINRITGVSANIDTQFNCDSFYSVIDLLLDHYRVLTSMEY
ncbi:hypothetical protein KEN51_CDS0222 [Pseudomonas phage vB_Pae10145-KEN51]|uniref:PHIKZ166 n=7 Tax=root TaxID=1 RepID=Q8SCZ6_BPDPK|nr:hypothetical protein [Pseudomonas aeruginosa]NP_803732.1 PHIKZ166 [Pseudomonas phage phiKZ]YP_009617491.1 hypothetical protein FDI90_gp203 [Pseudomonas phage PA7]YP_009619714.1 hypothetical protein FDJ06_gp174 [Pseudomonas phage SL2]ANM44963.1 hypothetical protein KTN4_205 [Pseudomonas phage KTN4]QGK89835.1 hypothetical protein [Pseudomonas phage vB_PA32_GUMS]QJB22841.1 hypothetical protein fnug_198 [Pseudomonas phage fnug]QOV08053.1 hypothetical protein [Pseudomonas phage vB_PaeM_kmuB]Q